MSDMFHVDLITESTQTSRFPLPGFAPFGKNAGGDNPAVLVLPATSRAWAARLSLQSPFNPGVLALQEINWP